MKRYSAYKETDLAWLKQAPAHWEVLPNIALFDERVDRGFVDDELLSVTITRGIVKQSEVEGKKDSSNEDKSNYKKVRVNDIAYNKMRMWQGAVGHSPFEGIVSPAYIVLKAKKDINPRFYHYLFRTPSYIRESYRNSYGICDDQLSLRYFDFKRMYSVVPPREEQDAIVAFLEAKEAQINKFIANKRRMIELLKEQKAALINRAVTRGLNPDAPMKPSGIDWLGDIPAHWSQKRFKFVARIESGQIDPKDGAFENTTLIAPNHIESGTGRLLYTETVKQQGAISGKYKVKAGQIIYSKIRPNLRKATVVDFDCLCSADMYALTVGQELKPEFMLHLLLSDAFTKFAVDCSMRVAMPKINRTALGNCWVAYPDVAEQEKILANIQETELPATRLVSSIENDIELIEEYRASLIDAAVTGKVDVRREAASAVEI